MVEIRLRQLLEDRGWTQRQLSLKTGIRNATISEMCNNCSKRLGVENLDKICKALNCEIGDLLVHKKGRV